VFLGVQSFLVGCPSLHPCHREFARHGCESLDAASTDKSFKCVCVPGLLPATLEPCFAFGAQGSLFGSHALVAQSQDLFQSFDVRILCMVVK
jgi:hypothetical protein